MATIWDDARKALPLPELMRQLGDGGAVPGRWGGPVKSPPCPFCQQPGKWSLREADDGRFSFHCYRDSCDANDPIAGNNEIGYLALRRGLASKEACTEFLRLALPDREKERSARPDAARANPAKNLRGGPWHELWKKLPLTAGDIELLGKKRGLTPETLELFGVRSNNLSNRALVESLVQDNFSELDLIELGILKSEEGRVKPAGQLYGWGRTGEYKCRKCATIFTTRRCPCGMKPRDEDAIWSGDVEPPLFPYFGKDGTAIYLRPHKGGVTNRERKFIQSIELADEDEDGPHECASHVYVPPNFAEMLETSNGTAIFTEGEHKVQAIVQAGLPAFACPGITFIRNSAFREELIDVIRHYGVRNVTVIFDNEVKNDPALPGFNADPRKQHQTQVWAEYTMRDLTPFLRARGGTVRVGRLPDAFRDAKGKADFDGILGKLCGELGFAKGTAAAAKIFHKAIKDSTDTPATSGLFPGDVRRLIERDLHLLFHAKINLRIGGRAEEDLAAAFRQWDAEGVFQWEGKPDTWKPEPHRVDPQMADAFESVHGCYFERKGFLDKDAKKHHVKILLPEVQGRIDSARGALKGLHDEEAKAKKHGELKLLYAYQRAIRERLKGKPCRISTCTLRGEFKLRTPGGTTVRLVRIFDSRDRQKASPLYRLSPEDSAQPSDLRKWLLGHGRGSWGSQDGGGQGSCDLLNMDLDNDVYLREIHSVTHCGNHEETGIWFFGDGGFMDDKANRDGKSLIIRPDDNGVFWSPTDGIGYLLDANIDGSSSTFALGLPKLFTPQRGDDDREGTAIFAEDGIGTALSHYIGKHCDQPCTKELRQLLLAMERGEKKASIETLLSIAPHEFIPVPDLTQTDLATQTHPLTELPVREALEAELARLIFQQIRDDLLITIGGKDAWIALGTILAYGFGPELVHRYYCHPGLFFVGEHGIGKSETARRLIRIWGMKDDASVDLSKTSTANALIRTLAQYSSIPIFFDEYRRTGDAGRQKEIDDLLRSATQRTQSHKATITSRTSTVSIPPRTSPFVCGNNSPQDAATASRYVHLTLAKARRLDGNDLAWNRSKHWCGHYYHLGRWLMKRRAAFAKRAITGIEEWISDTHVAEAIKENRERIVNGVGPETFLAAGKMLGIQVPEPDRKDFRRVAISFGSRMVSDVREDTSRSQFWRGIISALQRSTGMRKSFFSQKFIMIETEGETHGDDWLMTTEAARAALQHEDPHSTIAITNLRQHRYAIPALFIAAEPVFAEWSKDYIAVNRVQVPISFTNLRAELEKEPYFIQPARRRDKSTGKLHRMDSHRQKFIIGTGEEATSKNMNCICISLGKTLEETDPDGEPRWSDYVFPYAQEIMDALGAEIEI